MLWRLRKPITTMFTTATPKFPTGCGPWHSCLFKIRRTRSSNCVGRCTSSAVAVRWVRTTGLRLPLGHKFYDLIYREAETLGCALYIARLVAIYLALLNFHLLRSVFAFTTSSCELLSIFRRSNSISKATRSAI